MTDVTQFDTPETAEFGDFFALLKPRVMTLVVFTAFVGLCVAPMPMNPILAFASILFIALGAGASGSLNMWWDADIDAIMKRTQSRPVPSGRVTANNAMLVGVWLSVLSVGMLALTSNFFAAGFLAFTIFFYAVIYTMWLKRSTPHNIVIGGAAGAFPPMVGWAAVTGGISVESILMFALIFMWTPPHFWALALFTKSDYGDAGVPMLTVTHGPAVTRKHALWYAILLTPIVVALAFSSIGGPIFAIIGFGMQAVFVLDAIQMSRRTEDDVENDGYAVERKLFRHSLYYLFALFGALLAEAILRKAGLTLPFWPVWI
jgi:protoheme IX farnesyltransferase